MKCVICGERSEIEALCKDCYLHKNPFLNGYKKFSVKHCVDCKKWNLEHSWQNLKDVNPIIIEKVKKSLKLTVNDAEVVVVLDIPEHKKNPGIKAKCSASVEIEKIISGHELADGYDFPFVIEHTYCNLCSKKGTQYFEGIFQLRGSGKIFDDALAFLRAEIQKLESRGAFINKEVIEKKGIDLYLTSQRRLPKLIETVHKTFGGTMKVSEQLFTHDRLRSKDMYRVNVYLKLPSFGSGDVINVNNDILQVTSLSGKKIVGFNLRTWKKMSILYEHPELVFSSEQFIKAMVSKRKPALEVLHPETYQSTVVVNPKEIKHKKEIKIIIFENDVFLVD